MPDPVNAAAERGRRNRKLLLAVAGAAGLVALWFGASRPWNDPPKPTTPAARAAIGALGLPSAGPIIYTVSSNCSASVTYTGTGGTTEQQSGLQGGWSRQVSPGRLAHISARTDCSSSWVEVTIERDGHVFKDATSRGDYVTAEASVAFR